MAQSNYTDGYVANKLVAAGDSISQFDLNRYPTANFEALVSKIMEVRGELLPNLHLHESLSMEEAATEAATTIINRSETTTLAADINGLQAMYRTLGIVADGIYSTHLLNQLIERLGIKESPSINRMRNNVAAYGASVQLIDVAMPLDLAFARVLCNVASNSAIKAIRLNTSDMGSRYPGNVDGGLQLVLEGEHLVYSSRSNSLNMDGVGEVIEDTPKARRYVRYIQNKVFGSGYRVLMVPGRINRDAIFNTLNCGSMSLRMITQEVVENTEYFRKENVTLSMGSYSNPLDRPTTEVEIDVLLVVVYRQADLMLLHHINPNSVRAYQLPEGANHDISLLRAVNPRNYNNIITNVMLKNIACLKSDILDAMSTVLKVHQTLGAFSLCKAS